MTQTSYVTKKENAPVPPQKPKDPLPQTSGTFKQG